MGVHPRRQSSEVAGLHVDSAGTTNFGVAEPKLLQAAAAQLGADKPLVMGQSFGGAVALAWALDHPDHISGLILVSAHSLSDLDDASRQTVAAASAARLDVKPLHGRQGLAWAAALPLCRLEHRAQT